MSKYTERKVKEDNNMSAYVKPIQATPTLTGNDAIGIIRQVLKEPSPSAVEINRKMLEMRKRIEKK